MFHFVKRFGIINQTEVQVMNGNPKKKKKKKKKKTTTGPAGQ